MGESGLKAKGDNENTKATGGKLSICQSSRGVTALEAAGPQKRFIGKEAKECTTSFIYQKLLSYMSQQIAGIFNLLIVPASSNAGEASSCSRPVEGTETTQSEPRLTTTLKSKTRRHNKETVYHMLHKYSCQTEKQHLCSSDLPYKRTLIICLDFSSKDRKLVKTAGMGEIFMSCTEILSLES